MRYIDHKQAVNIATFACMATDPEPDMAILMGEIMEALGLTPQDEDEYHVVFSIINAIYDIRKDPNVDPIRTLGLMIRALLAGLECRPHGHGAGSWGIEIAEMA